MNFFLFLLYRLIMGKVKIDIFSVSLGIFGISFYRNVYWVVLYLSYGFIKLAEIDWLPGRQKGKF